MRHSVKIKQCHLCHILEGSKKFEIRLNDRDYQVGDTIDFLPLEDNNYNVYKIKSPIPSFEIIYMHSGYGMQNDFVVLGIEEIPLIMNERRRFRLHCQKE